MKTQDKEALKTTFLHLLQEVIPTNISAKNRDVVNELLKMYDEAVIAPSPSTEGKEHDLQGWSGDLYLGKGQPTAEEFLMREEWLPNAGWTKDNIIAAMEAYSSQKDKEIERWERVHSVDSEIINDLTRDLADRDKQIEGLKQKVELNAAIANEALERFDAQCEQIEELKIKLEMQNNICKHEELTPNYRYENQVECKKCGEGFKITH